MLMAHILVLQGSDYVLMCVRDGDTAAIVQSYNDGRSNGPFSNVSQIS